MTIEPNHDITEHFGVRVIAPLGGRFNKHWLVEAQGQQLVLRCWSQPQAEIDYEVRLLARLAALGWPVAQVVAGPVNLHGRVWSLAPFLAGELAPAKNSIQEQRTRGHLLAEFHNDLAQLSKFGQRGTWRRCEVILADPRLDQILLEYERDQPEEAWILRWHLHRARERIAELQLDKRPGIVIHGDFAQWNLLFQHGKLSGILDFELAHWDHRVADFALSWRGTYDDVIHAYNKHSPLDPEEWELLTPMWWAWLIDCACQQIAQGVREDSWTIKQILRRSPLMGPDATPFHPLV